MPLAVIHPQSYNIAFDLFNMVFIAREIYGSPKYSESLTVY